MKLEFVQDAYFDGVHVHKVGDIVDIDNSLGHADRWIRLGMAIKYSGPTKVLVEEKEIVDDIPVSRQDSKGNKSKGRRHNSGIDAL